MEETTKHPVLYYISKGISYLFHPFLMPVWLLVILFGFGVLPVYMSAEVRNYILTVILINTVCVPMLAVILLRVFGVISDYSLSTRKDRTLPLLLVALCYGLCGWMLGASPMLFLLRKIMFAAMSCTLFALIVNFRWQVSLHMTAIGGAVGVVLVLIVAGYSHLIWVFCGVVLAAGLLGSSRLYLGKHTPAQIGVGFLGGFLIVVLVLLFWM